MKKSILVSFETKSYDRRHHSLLLLAFKPFSEHRVETEPFMSECEPYLFEL